jgi:hypothetical protein
MMNKTEFKAAVSAAGKIRKKSAEDAFLLAFGFGLQRGHTKSLGALIVRCAKRLLKQDVNASDMKKIVAVAKKAGK